MAAWLLLQDGPTSARIGLQTSISRFIFHRLFSPVSFCLLFSRNIPPFAVLYLSRGMQPFGVSGPHWKKKSCLGPHVKYTNIKTDEGKKILSKFTIVYWTAFIAILGRMWPMACGLDTSEGCGWAPGLPVEPSGSSLQL